MYVILSVVFVSTSALEVFENIVSLFPPGVPPSRLEPLTWFDCLYLMVITLTTIGYARASGAVCMRLCARCVVLLLGRRRETVVGRLAVSPVCQLR